MFTTKELNTMFGGKFTVNVRDYTNKKFGDYHKADGGVYFKYFNAANKCAQRLRKFTMDEYVETDVMVYVRDIKGYIDGVYTIDHAGYGDCFELIAA